jgi:hypothetical protein
MTRVVVVTVGDNLLCGLLNPIVTVKTMEINMAREVIVTIWDKLLCGLLSPVVTVKTMETNMTRVVLVTLQTIYSVVYLPVTMEIKISMVSYNL